MPLAEQSRLAFPCVQLSCLQDRAVALQLEEAHHSETAVHEEDEVAAVKYEGGIEVLEGSSLRGGSKAAEGQVR